jgi:DNA-binding NarL/FixJ family response regulator
LALNSKHGGSGFSMHRDVARLRMHQLDGCSRIMGCRSDQPEQQLPATPWGQLPPSMRVLFIKGSAGHGNWLAKVLAADSASDVKIQNEVGMTAGLARLRDEIFDAVLIGHETGSLDALEVLDAIRAGSSDEQPILVLGEQSEQEMAALCFEAGSDAYVCINTTTTRTLIWLIARAVERHALVAENRRLRLARRHQQKLERDEAERLLRQQRKMIAGPCDQLSDISTNVAVPEDDEHSTGGGLGLPLQLTDHYRELLRTYVIMGSGNLAEEMQRLGELLVAARVSPRQVMRLHLHVLEELIRGLGSRSARHVMNRADMLVLEVMIYLTERYRRDYLQRVHPPRQLSLPGFSAA